MPQFNYRHSKSSSSSSSSFFPAFRSGLIVGIMLVLILILMACGDQNTPVSSQGAVGISSQDTSSANGLDQGQPQGQPATTTSAPKSSKATPKPAATSVKGPSGTVHICSLLTKDEAAASLSGASLQVDAAADALGEFGNASCNYTSSTGGLTVQVSIISQSLADFENNFKTLNAQVVPDLGDAAFYIGGQLSTLKGKVGVVVMLLNPVNGADTLSSATLVTQEILTALTKTSHASDLTSTGAAISSKPVTQADIPVYPGATRFNSEDSGVGILSSFTSPDSYEKIVAWYKQTFEDKEWYGSYVMEFEPGYTIASAGKSSNDGAIQTNIVASIYGPKKADRQPRKDENDKLVILDPGATLIEVLITGNK